MTAIETLIFFIGCGTILYVVVVHVLPSLGAALKGLWHPQVASATVGCIVFISISLFALGTNRSWLLFGGPPALLVCLAIPHWLRKVPAEPKNGPPSDKK